MFEGLQLDSRSLVDNVITIIYFMRGAVSYTEAMNMSYAERSFLSEFIGKRLETEKKSPAPVY